MAQYTILDVDDLGLWPFFRPVRGSMQASHYDWAAWVLHAGGGTAQVTQLKWTVTHDTGVLKAGVCSAAEGGRVDQFEGLPQFSLFSATSSTAAEWCNQSAAVLLNTNETYLQRRAPSTAAIWADNYSQSASNARLTRREQTLD